MWWKTERATGTNGVDQSPAVLMRLYFLRHGEAEQRTPDASRKLTPAGRSETAAVCRQVAALIHPPIDAVVASPLIRAGQTAAIAVENLPCFAAVSEISPSLLPESRIEQLVEMVEAFGDGTLLAVGHQPLLGDFLAWLCDDDTLSRIPTSGFYAVDTIALARGGGSLLWSVAP